MDRSGEKKLSPYLLHELQCNDILGWQHFINEVSLVHSDTNLIFRSIYLSYKTYEVRIRGASVKQDHILWGNFTDFLRFTTKKDLPGAAPASVSVVNTTPPGVVQVSWIPIPAQYENGELLKYILTYRRQNWQVSTDIVVPVKQTIVRIEDLLPWRFYEVRDMDTVLL